jgi:hypothetical protein
MRNPVRPERRDAARIGSDAFLLPWILVSSPLKEQGPIIYKDGSCIE